MAQSCALLPHEQAHGFARVAERQDEEARAPVLARLRMADHRAVAVFDLRFLAHGGGDDHAGVDRRAPAEVSDEATDAGVARREAVVIDQVLPDRHGIPAAAERVDNQLAVRVAGARRSSWRRPRRRGVGVDTSAEMAAFGFSSPGRPRPRITIPAARKYALTVSRRTPVSRSMRRSVQPRRPNARICRCVLGSKTFPIDDERNSQSLVAVNVSTG